MAAIPERQFGYQICQSGIVKGCDQIEASATQLRSTGTLTFDNTVAVTEHGLFSQAATGGGVLWDRSIFTAVNVVSGDSIQFQYTASLTAGG
jgi:hypothetical protein